MFLSLRRIIKTGFVNFWRNGFVSLSSIVVMTITLFVIGSLIFLNALLTTTLTTLKDKVDVNVYFVADASEERMHALEGLLRAQPEVREVTFTSREDALARFREEHRGDTVELAALDELGDNPFLASLSVRATDPSQYPKINEFLESDRSVLSKAGDQLIEKVNWKDNRAAIENLERVIRGTESFGLIVSTALIIATIVIVFNTIRMAIYISREEIAVMRLVGASDAYIRGPFVCEGALYGFVAALVTLVSFYPLGIWLGPKTEQFFGSINIFLYYTAHFGPIFLTIVGTGIFLGALASFLAVKKYLRV